MLKSPDFVVDCAVKPALKAAGRGPHWFFVWLEAKSVDLMCCRESGTYEDISHEMKASCTWKGGRGWGGGGGGAFASTFGG